MEVRISSREDLKKRNNIPRLILCPHFGQIFFNFFSIIALSETSSTFIFESAIKGLVLQTTITIITQLFLNPL